MLTVSPAVCIFMDLEIAAVDTWDLPPCISCWCPCSTVAFAKPCACTPYCTSVALGGIMPPSYSHTVTGHVLATVNKEHGPLTSSKVRAFTQPWHNCSNLTITTPREVGLVGNWLFVNNKQCKACLIWVHSHTMGLQQQTVDGSA